jgi:hypothetical protein
MYTDKQTLCSDSQVVTATAVSTNSYDTGNLTPKRDIGRGEDLRAIAQIVGAPTGGTSIQGEIIQADDSALTTNVETLSLGPVVAVAAALAGKRLIDQVLPSNTRRFVGFRYTVVGSPSPGATIQAGLFRHGDSMPAPVYPSGYSTAL